MKYRDTLSSLEKKEQERVIKMALTLKYEKEKEEFNQRSRLSKLCYVIKGYVIYYKELLFNQQDRLEERDKLKSIVVSPP